MGMGIHIVVLSSSPPAARLASTWGLDPPSIPAQANVPSCGCSCRQAGGKMAFWGVLTKKLASLTAVGRRRLEDEGGELQWLQRALLHLRATLWDAERRQIKDEGLLLWLQRIKDVVCEAEDVIDELEYKKLRRLVKGRRSRASGTSRSALPSSNKATVHRINQIRLRLEDVAKDKNGLGIGDLSNSDGQEGRQRRMMQTSSLLKEGEVLGREKEKEEVIEFLLASDDEVPPSTVAITGMGGLGKTTLAQLVYNDRRVEEHFNLKMWVCTTADYDVVKLTSEILGSTGYDMRFLWGVENLDAYQRKLMENLKGRRFLLVIDNLWDPNHGKWQSLSAPLFHGEKGSKVVVTTRDTKVAKILQTRKMVELQGLPFQDCWMLFKRHAFSHGNSAEYPRLEAIGKQIVGKFEGVPLAAIAIGDLLYSKLDEGEWIRIAESGTWELEGGEDGILFILKLSYEHLPPQLKQCFAYCTLFPKGFKFDKFELVQQWMAQGFVHGGGSGRMEDVGTEYLNDLFSKSFFQFVDGRFVMHDLIHDLALLISRHDHLITDIDGSHCILKGSHKFRHLSLLIANKQPDQGDLEGLCAYGGLRTLAFHFPYDSRFKIPHDLFLSLKSLRVLDLSYGGIEELPDSIGNLKHLRYLDLRRNNFRSLPESLCCLYLLQTLKLEGCHQIEKLPRGISNLINLRHLEVKPHLLSGVEGIGKLTCLQELESFSIPQGHGIKIDDLKDMNELRGTLCIYNLHRVRSKEDAAGAMLNNKRHIHKLKMEWRWGVFAECRNANVEDVVDALVPPANLKELAIKGYDGVRCPGWIANHVIAKLESLCLTICKNLNSIPLIWCLPFLKRIEIVDCPRLKALPSLPTTLKELTLRSLELEELPDFYRSHDHEPAAGVICGNVSPSLSVLRIESCNALRSLQRGLLRHHLRNLIVLSIESCGQLVHWPEGAGFQATFLSLQGELSLKGCPKLMAFPGGSNLSASLKKLTIMGCPGVVKGPLFAQLHNLSSESVVHVRKGYANLACCSEEALQNLKAVDCLVIDEATVEEDGDFSDPQLIALVCHTVLVWSWRLDDWVVAWRVQIRCRRPSTRPPSMSLPVLLLKPVGSSVPPSSVLRLPPEQEWWERLSPATRRAVSPDQHDNSLISELLGGHHIDHFPWASSLRWLVLAANRIFHGAFPSVNLASLEGLWISRCGGTRPLLSDSLLCHLTGLEELQFFDCPELTLPSLQEALRSLPSLRHLTIEKCPDLSSSLFSSSQYYTPLVTTSSITPTLQTLFVDDSDLLGDAQFVRDQLGSLRGLHIWHANHASFTTAAGGGLTSLGQSIQHLSIMGCPHLKHLPPDLQSLLPSLKALAIGHCPMLQRLPEGALPALLEILVVNNCPSLLGGHGRGRQHEQNKDWPKVAHVPVIVINEVIVQGSYREFLELKAKWRNF